MAEMGTAMNLQVIVRSAGNITAPHLSTSWSWSSCRLSCGCWAHTGCSLLRAWAQWPARTLHETVWRHLVQHAQVYAGLRPHAPQQRPLVSPGAGWRASSEVGRPGLGQQVGVRDLPRPGPQPPVLYEGVDAAGVLGDMILS